MGEMIDTGSTAFEGLGGDIIGYVMLGLLGLLVLTALFGIFWGLIRGAKRSAYRLITVIIALLLAFSLAPVITNALGGIRISADVFGYQLTNMTLAEFVRSLVADNAMVVAVMDNFVDLSEVILAVPMAILSVIVFYVLWVVLRVLTWIIYAATAKKVAPKKIITASGEETPTKRRRGLGLLIGLVQGIVIFFFMAIPINGIIRTVDQIDSYTPAFVQTGHATSIESFDGIFDMVSEINTDLQTSWGYGFITRYTGMQLLSGPMFSYLTTIRTDNVNVNMRGDIIMSVEIFKDVMAIFAQFYDEDGEMIPFDVALRDMHADYINKGVVGVINKLFDMDTTRLILNSIPSAAGFVEDMEYLIDADGVPTMSFFSAREDQDELEIEAVNREFNETLIGAIRKINASTLKSDLLALIDIVNIVFRQTTTVGTGPSARTFNLYEGVMEVVNTFGDNENPDSLKEAADLLFALIGAEGNDPTKSIIYDLFSKLFELSIFSEILVTPSQPATGPTSTQFDGTKIIRIPVMQFLNLTESDLDFDIIWYDEAKKIDTARDIAELFIHGVQAIVGISPLLTSDDMLMAFADIDDPTIDSIGRVLDMVTQDLGISPTIVTYLEKFLRDFVDNDDENGEPGIFDDYLGDFVDMILDALKDGTIRWAHQLRTIRGSVKLIASVMGDGDMDMDALINSIFDPENGLFEMLANDPIIGGIVLNYMEEFINDALENVIGDVLSFQVNGTAAEVFGALNELTSSIQEVMHLLNSDEPMDPETLGETIGAMFENIAFNFIDDDGNSPITIAIGGDYAQPFAEMFMEIQGYEDATPEQQQHLENVLKGLFGITWTPPTP
jgi:hypothetical protein